MAASALRQPATFPRESAAAPNRAYLRAIASAQPAPIAPLRIRRPLLNAAAQEALASDLRFAAGITVLACCIGIGLAMGIYWDEILADFRIMTFAAEQPRWLWQIVDAL